MEIYKKIISKKLEKEDIYIKAIQLYKASRQLAENMFIHYRGTSFYTDTDIENLVKTNEELIQHIESLEIYREQEEITDLNAVFSLLFKLRNSAEKIARVFLVCNNLFIEFGLMTEHKQIQKLVKLINEFRILFLDWIQFFNKYWEYEDKWGLTNPILQFPAPENISLKDDYYGSNALNI